MSYAYEMDDGRERMDVGDDKAGIALVLIPALTGWMSIVVLIVAQMLVGSSAGLVGMLFTFGVILVVAALVARDARTWGLEGGGMAAFVVLFFLFGYPIYMRTRGNRGAPLGLGAGLCAMALMILPFVLLPLGASVLARKLAASQPPPAPFVMPPAALASATALLSDPAAQWKAYATLDSATCTAFECRVRTLGPKAKVVLDDPANAGKRVRMDEPTQPQLASLANAPGITKLNLAIATRPGGFYEHATDFKPVGALTQLEELSMDGSFNSDLTAFEPLIHLEKLTLLDTSSMTSLNGLASLVNLKSFEVSIQSFSDLSPLGELTNLQSLKLRSGSKLDLSPLAKLGALRELDLVAFHNTSMKPLGGLKGVRTLSISGNSLTDMDALSGMTGVESLVVATHVTSIAFVSGMRGLTHLDADGNPGLQDLTPLKSLPALASLELNDAGIEDLSALSSCTHLKSLSIRRTTVKSLAPLASLKELVTLNLSGIRGVDLAPIAKMPGLKYVTLYSDQVSAPALAAFTKAAPGVKVTLVAH